MVAYELVLVEALGVDALFVMVNEVIDFLKFRRYLRFEVINPHLGLAH